MKGVAIHHGPESCVGSRKVAGEVLTGGNAGQPLSSEITLLGRRPYCMKGKATRRGAIMQARRRPYGVVDPVHAWTLYAREPGGPSGARG